MESRKNQYKHAHAGVDKIRNKKKGEQNELRKDRREELLCSKRTRHGVSESSGDDVTVEQMREAARLLVSKKDDRMAFLKLLRNGFAQGTALIDAFLEVDGSMACLVGLLTGSDAEVQLMCAWCMTNMAAGTDHHAQLVIKHAVPYLVTFLSSSSPALQDQCAWTIGNLAGGNEECRRQLIKQGAIHSLVPLLTSTSKNVIKSSAFALSNMARDAPARELMMELNVMTSLSNVLSKTDEDEEVLTESSWVLTYLSAHRGNSDVFMTTGLLDKLVDQLISCSKKQDLNVQLVTPLVRSIGNFVCDVPSARVPSSLGSSDLISSLERILTSDIVHLHKECVWALSNIAVHKNLASSLISSNLLKPIVNLLDSIVEVRYEAAYCLCNVAQHENSFAESVYEAGCIPKLVPLLKSKDHELNLMALSLLAVIFEACQEKAVITFEESRGLEAFEVLEYSNNNTVMSKTNAILEQFIYKFIM